MVDFACEFDAVSFKYKNSEEVLKEASLKIPMGAAVCVAGRNGAGKSTLINLGLGRLRPKSGEVKIFGSPLKHWKQRSSIGYAPQHSVLPDLAPVKFVLSMVAEHYRYAGFEPEVDKLIDALNLEQVLPKRCAALSGGLAKRVSLACALMHNPSLAVLDEPTAGLDREGRALLLELLVKHIASGRSILWTTHNPSDLFAMNSRVALLRDGKVTDWGSIWGLVESEDSSLLEVMSANAPESVLGLKIHREGAVGRYVVKNKDLAEVEAALAREGHRATRGPLTPEIFMSTFLGVDSEDS